MVHLFQIFTNRAEREYVGALESSHQMGGNDVSGRLMEITSYGQPLSDRHLPRISAWKANLPAFLCFLKKYSHGLLPREIGASISGAHMSSGVRPRLLESCSASMSHARMRCFAGSS